MEKKLVLFDIDGTLVNEEKKLPDSAKEAIKNIKEKGHIVGIATGRTPFMFKELREELDMDTYVSINGQYVVSNGIAIYKNPISPDSIQRLIALCGEYGHPIAFENEKDVIANKENHPHVKEAIESLKFDYPKVNPEYWLSQEVYQILLFNDENKEEWYKDKFKELEFIRWHKYSSDVIPKGGSKANGIKHLVRHLGIDLNDVYAFGDGLNDIEMFKFVPNSIAMGNAREELKKIAKYQTTNVDDFGILNGLKMIGLL